MGTATVAQSCTLPYRGFSIRLLWKAVMALPLSTACRMQFGDTADYKSALQALAR
jgi:hypothetical protein